MRQIALHPGLIPSDYVENLRVSDSEYGDIAPIVQISEQDKIRLQGMLLQAIEDSEECPICMSDLTTPRITSCGHTFCLPWLVDLAAVGHMLNQLKRCSITEVISRDPKCPMVGLTFYYTKLSLSDFRIEDPFAWKT
jgi:SWI/SNF-related matrix-associated actin-dependent regulator of chromatin subfamily A3